jgi:hypothetical protein
VCVCIFATGSRFRLGLGLFCEASHGVEVFAILVAHGFDGHVDVCEACAELCDVELALEVVAELEACEHDEPAVVDAVDGVDEGELARAVEGAVAGAEGEDACLVVVQALEVGVDERVGEGARLGHGQRAHGAYRRRRRSGCSGCCSRASRFWAPYGCGCWWLGG